MQPDGAQLIAAERFRQVNEEGWSANHDDNEHLSGELGMAAIGYIASAENLDMREHWPSGDVTDCWPLSWDDEWDKRATTSRLRALVKAGALVAAEIDRLHRRADRQEKDRET